MVWHRKVPYVFRKGRDEDVPSVLRFDKRNPSRPTPTTPPPRRPTGVGQRSDLDSARLFAREEAPGNRVPSRPAGRRACARARSTSTSWAPRWRSGDSGEFPVPYPHSPAHAGDRGPGDPPHHPPLPPASASALRLGAPTLTPPAPRLTLGLSLAPTSAAVPIVPKPLVAEVPEVESDP